MGTTPNYSIPTPNDGDQWNLVTDLDGMANVIDTAIKGVDNDVTTLENSVSILTNGYRRVQTIYFTSSGTFTKASYPWLKAIQVKVQAGGGGGGGCGTTGTGAIAAGKGGTGGVYAEGFITNISDLPASVTCTVGSGGTGGAAGSNNGNAGGDSSFGTSIIATGGYGGGVTDFGGQLIWNAGAVKAPLSGLGDLIIPGGPSTAAFSLSFTSAFGAAGGNSFLGQSNPGSNLYATGQSAAGDNAYGYGAGGGGAISAQNNTTARAGGNGSPGIIIVELYA